MQKLQNVMKVTLFCIYYFIFSWINSSCNEQKQSNFMENNTWNKSLAMEYFKAYAKFENKRLEEQLIVNDDKRIRADLGSAELEYNDSLKVMIVRGLIDLRIFRGTQEFLDIHLKRINELNNNLPKNFQGAVLELDKTAFELNKDFPQRLNLRKDYNEPIGIDKFIKQVDKLTTTAYNFSESTYHDMIMETNRIVFPTKSSK
jgi:hypothetical protein